MITLKLKKNNKFEVVKMPPVEQITAAILATWIEKPCVLEFAEGEKKIYAYGNESVRGAWELGKIVMDMRNFCDYWRYKMLDYGIDVFSRLEAREERIAICEADGVPQETIDKILADKPLMYGTQQELGI